MTTAAEVTDTTRPPQQLRMVWPRQRLTDPPEVRVHPDYELRTYRPGDEVGWIRVMDLAGFGLWDMERLTATMQTILPNGWFLAVHRATDVIVATAMTTHHPTELHPFGGELGWVEADGAVIQAGLILGEDEVGRVDGPEQAAAAAALLLLFLPDDAEENRRLAR